MLKILLAVNLTLILFNSETFAKSSIVVKKAGVVHLFKNSYYPTVRELKEEDTIDVDDSLFTNTNSRALLYFSENIPVFIDEKTSFEIKKINQEKRKQLYKLYLQLNYGEIKTYSKGIFISTPTAFIETMGGETIVNHDNKSNFTRAITLNGNLVVSKNKGASKRLLVFDNQSIDIYDPSKTGQLDFPNDFKVLKLNPRVISEIKKKYTYNILLEENYKPSILDNFYKFVLLNL